MSDKGPFVVVFSTKSGSIHAVSRVFSSNVQGYSMLEMVRAVFEEYAEKLVIEIVSLGGLEAMVAKLQKSESDALRVLTRNKRQRMVFRTNAVRSASHDISESNAERAELGALMDTPSSGAWVVLGYLDATGDAAVSELFATLEDAKAARNRFENQDFVFYQSIPEHLRTQPRVAFHVEPVGQLETAVQNRMRAWLDQLQRLSASSTDGSTIPNE